MKKIRYLMVCLAAVLTGLYFVSCGNDESDSPSSDLVGTWASTYDVDNEFMMFCADGTCYFYELCSEHGFDEVEKGAYTYNPNKERLSFVWGDEVEMYDVVVLTRTQLVINFISSYRDDVYTYTKVKSTYTASQLEKMANKLSSNRNY